MVLLELFGAFEECVLFFFGVLESGKKSCSSFFVCSWLDEVFHGWFFVGNAHFNLLYNFLILLYYSNGSHICQ